MNDDVISLVFNSASLFQILTEAPDFSYSPVVGQVALDK